MTGCSASPLAGHWPASYGPAPDLTARKRVPTAAVRSWRSVTPRPSHRPDPHILGGPAGDLTVRKRQLLRQGCRPSCLTAPTIGHRPAGSYVAVRPANRRQSGNSAGPATGGCHRVATGWSRREGYADVTTSPLLQDTDAAPACFSRRGRRCH